ncbi:hypothetical protein ACROYT_G018198 [Oculina patagonica]
MSSANVLPSAPAYGVHEEDSVKHAEAQTLYPALPQQNDFRLQKANEVLKYLSEEVDHYRLVAKKYKRTKTIINYACFIAGGVSGALSAGGWRFWSLIETRSEASPVEPSELSELLTFNTPFGRYQYLRMPFGINSAPEIFQKRMTQDFEDLSGVKTIAERSRKVGLKLNRSKMKILTAEVPYIGHVLTSNGLKPDPSKVHAVEEMPSPADKPAF